MSASQTQNEAVPPLNPGDAVVTDGGKVRRARPSDPVHLIWQWGLGAQAEKSAPDFAASKAHVLSRLAATPVGEHPFYHLFIEEILPPDLYDEVRRHMAGCKHGGQIQDRLQDNAAFVNKRFNLFRIDHPAVNCIRDVFSDPEVKLAILRKFYLTPTPEMVASLSIHEEFEYFFTRGGRFQNIHVDIPPKFVSFVFYLPEHPVPPEEEARNATVLYDKELRPHHPARFRHNSVCIFVPHFYTYHGFASTIDRDVMVLFYVSQPELERWWKHHEGQEEAAPWTALLDCIEGKIRANPLIEYGTSENRILSERAGCRVNAPNGRVMRDN